MHSTRNPKPRYAKPRNAKLSPALKTGLLSLIALLLGCPPAPQHPRFVGAGNTEPIHGGTLTFDTSTDIRTLDPHVAFDVVSVAAAKLVFDGLLDYDQDANLVPRLAEALPEVSKDGRIFHLKLKKGSRFHNGREITADDVKWSIERVLNKKTGSPAYPFFALIKGVEAYRDGSSVGVEGIRVLEPYTIEFELTKPDQTFLHALAMTFSHPVPREVYGFQPQPLSGKTVGTGPFKLESWEPGVQLIFVRNKDYHEAGKPYLDRMVMQLNVSADTAVRRFRNGELDILDSFPLADYLFFKTNKSWQPYLVEEPSITIWGLAMNCEMAPFNNVHVRRAVSFAINRPWWERALNHRIHIAGQPLPPGLLGYDEQLEGLQVYDPIEAKREMALAGYPRGINTPVTMWTQESQSANKLGELIQSDLAKIGIKVELKPVSFPVYLESTAKEKTAQLFVTGWLQDFPDPSDFLDTLFHSRAIHPRDSENRSFYRNPKLDKLLDKARVEQNLEKRRKLYVKAQQLIVKDAPWAFIWNQKDMIGWQPYVKNFYQHPVWPQYVRDVWLDLPKVRFKKDHKP